MLNHNLTSWYKLLKYIFVRVTIAIRVMHNELPFTTSLKFKDFKCIGKTNRSPPKG